MKKILIGALFAVLFNGHLFSEGNKEGIVLWKSFTSNMSSSEVIETLKDFEYLTSFKKEKKGIKPSIGKGDCPIKSKSQIRVLNSVAIIHWCFDKPMKKKEVKTSTESRLKMIKIYLGSGKYGKFSSVVEKLDIKYKYNSFDDILKKAQVSDAEDRHKCIRKFNASAPLAYTNDMGLMVGLNTVYFINPDDVLLTFEELNPYILNMKRKCQKFISSALEDDDI
jgi:hypothetical protein|tara:strand:+ start:318 stop:986 length:669 start_codon:yes stop_codon:yes gene_type:complete